MSRENVGRFFQAVQDDESARRELMDADAGAVIRLASERDMPFTEGELKSVLKEMLYNATSLPRGWGWPLARRLGLVRA